MFGDNYTVSIQITIRIRSIFFCLNLNKEEFCRINLPNLALSYPYRSARSSLEMSVFSTPSLEFLLNLDLYFVQSRMVIAFFCISCYAFEVENRRQHTSTRIYSNVKRYRIVIITASIVNQIIRFSSFHVLSKM